MMYSMSTISSSSSLEWLLHHTMDFQQQGLYFFESSLPFNYLDNYNYNTSSTYWMPNENESSSSKVMSTTSSSVEHSDSETLEEKSALEDLYMGIDIIPTKSFSDHLPIPFYDEGIDMFANFDDHQQKELNCLDHLLSPPSLLSHQEVLEVLVKSAEAFSDGKYGLVGLLLARLEGFSSPHGDSLQRLSFYASEALKNHSFLTPTITLCGDKEEGFSSLGYDMAYQAFCKLLPYQKFLHFASNQAILEAIGASDCVHIIDLDIRQGLQWPSFFQSISTRPLKLLRITAIGKDTKKLKHTGRHLEEFARSLGIQFSFHVVIADIKTMEDDVRVLGLEQNETLVVNCSVVLSRLLSISGRIHGFLGFLRKLNPVVLTLMEIESNQNMPSFVGRFLQCLVLHRALFSSIEGCIGRDDPDRELIERLYLAPNISDVVLECDKESSIRYACMDSWRKYLRHSDFKDTPLSHYNQCQANLLLGWFSNEGFKVHQDGCSMTLSWQDTPLVSFSSWTC